MDREEVIDFGFDPTTNPYRYNPVVADTTNEFQLVVMGCLVRRILDKGPILARHHEIRAGNERAQEAVEALGAASCRNSPMRLEGI